MTPLLLLLPFICLTSQSAVIQSITQEELANLETHSIDVHENIATKIKASIQNELQIKHVNQEQPKIVLQKNGRAIDLTAYYQDEILIKKLQEIVDPQLIILDTVKDFNSLMRMEGKKVLWITEKTFIKEILEGMLNEDVLVGDFHIAFATDVTQVGRPEQVVPERVVLYDGDKAEIFEGEISDIQGVLEWIQHASLNDINILDDENMFRIFAGQRTKQVLLFLDVEKETENEKVITILKSVQKKNHELQEFEKFNFVIIYDTEQNSDYFDYFDVDDTMTPRVFISTVKNAQMQKFALEGEITIENIEIFMDQYSKDELKESKKSQILQNNNDSIQSLNYNQFRTSIINNRSNQIVLFYAQKDLGREESNKALIYLEFMQEKIKKVNQNIQFYKYNIDHNEFKEFNLQRLPEFRIYLRGEKKEPKFYNKGTELKKFMEFYNMFFPEQQITLTQRESDEVMLKSMSPKDREGILKARERVKEQGLDSYEPNESLVHLHNWNEESWETGVPQLKQQGYTEQYPISFTMDEM